MDRRKFLEVSTAAGLAALSPPFAIAKDREINDVTRLNPVRVADERRPRTTDDVRSALREWKGPISVGGGRFSMGGQIAADDSLHLDMRAMKQVVSLNVPGRWIRVQSGATWRDIQEAIDPHDLSVRIMQSYSNFSVGGSVSVNCHGRYVGKGPLVNSVRALQLVTADGTVRELTQQTDPELFGAVFGGYGGLGVITEVELDLDRNSRIERVVEDVPLDHYPEYFRGKVVNDARMVLHNADLTPPHFASPRAVSWVMTDKPLTLGDRLVPRGLNYSLEKNAIWAMTELPGGNRLRDRVVDKVLLAKKAVTWRNHEASLDTASLEPRTRSISTYLLQEYFIPVPNFLPFARRMAHILRSRRVNALNISIRHSPADTVSLMRWAPLEVFAFVLYYKQRVHPEASAKVGVWTRELIDEALANGGRYYLPYRLDASLAQFRQSYPECSAYRALKARLDPDSRFRNRLMEKYILPA